jgi:hypothetical protein
LTWADWEPKRVAACDHLDRGAERILVNIAHASNLWSPEERIVYPGHAHQDEMEPAVLRRSEWETGATASFATAGDGGVQFVPCRARLIGRTGLAFARQPFSSYVALDVMLRICVKHEVFLVKVALPRNAEKLPENQAYGSEPDA